MSKLEMLSKYGTDLTKLAEMGKLEAIGWREPEIEVVMQILCKKSKSNPCLVGSPGIGISSIIEGLAIKIANGSAPSRFRGKRVFSLSEGQLNSGCESNSQFEQRLIKLMNELKQTNGMVILFVEPVKVLTRIGAAINQCIGALTEEEFKKQFNVDAVLRQHFHPVELPPPSIQETIELLKVLRVRYGSFHNVRYLDEALVTAANLSNKNISGNESLVDKAVDLIDEAGARASLELKEAKKKVVVVTGRHIEELIPSPKKRPKPITSATQKKSKSLRKMEESLCKHIIGQEHAVEAISRALLRAQAGIRDPRRPIASFLFTGTTGVGKTELANAVAIEYFGSIQSMKRFDMSECMEKHAVSKLFGAPPGYVGYSQGGQLTEAVRKQPKMVVLFDEIEKAHQDVYNALLQVLEDGRLTDGQGITVDFTNTIIVLTSNLGHKIINKAYSEFGVTYNQLKSQVTQELKKFFRLELLNRLDDVIVFQQLRDQDDLRKILEIMLSKLIDRVKQKNISVEIRDSVKNKLIKEGFDPLNGARPLRRCITRLVENPLAEWISDGDVQEGETVIVDLDHDGNVVVEDYPLYSLVGGTSNDDGTKKSYFAGLLSDSCN